MDFGTNWILKQDGLKNKMDLDQNGVWNKMDLRTKWIKEQNGF